MRGAFFPLAVQVDLLDDSAPKEMISSAVQNFGGFDILVNNPGIYPSVHIIGYDHCPWYLDG
ncbi:NAD(P)-binding domain protein [Acididesulfobacillus acetoxydans]|uniref:NAD(P)-binding domain protein n=1 Tax=Acididesulfobacillus acetoxydans TaxID=1561005 RepID=A0A8S0W1M9_9FIRM|nr:NAD(P)-binding domain protein [Acididesulfobacillus acetoxydans]CEJ07773.1 dTDP-4-dehydrorhamnose reductase [Acididesulfobacillus acetoxydans]